MGDMVQILEVVGRIRAATDATCAYDGEEQGSVEILWWIVGESKLNCKKQTSDE